MSTLNDDGSKNKKTNQLVGLGCLVAIVFACLIVGANSIKSKTDSAEKITDLAPAPAYNEIRNQMQSMTDVGWKEYLDRSVIGKKVSWAGWVDDVKSYNSRENKVMIDMDPPGTFMSVQDIYLYPPIDQTKNLVKGQLIEFTGVISTARNVLGDCQISIDDAKINTEF